MGVGEDADGVVYLQERVQKAQEHTVPCERRVDDNHGRVTFAWPVKPRLNVFGGVVHVKGKVQGITA